MTHLTESLVFVPLMIGVLFFLFEFFLDQFLAFQVLSLVWTAEVYSTITLRTMISMRYFPRVFFAYFSLFHVYFFCFPFGYSYPALVTAVLFLLHAMFCFWNYCELPALNSGSITALRPRFGVEERETPVVRPPTVLPNAPVDAVASFPGNPRRHRVLRPSFQRPTSHRVSGTARSNVDSSPARTFSPSPGPNLRDTFNTQYSRHIEHSRRIQNQQMAALLGLPIAGIAEVPSDDVGLDLDDISNRPVNQQQNSVNNPDNTNYISHTSSSDSDVPSNSRSLVAD